MIHPTTQRHARIWALVYVREMVKRGYRSAQAAKETNLGRGGPNEAGYNINHGKISVPACRPNWTFRFTELEREARTSPPVRPVPAQMQLI
ncbi:MAG: hypothetical protein EOP87_00025 [Verrucomicrobiaceae bacterium]|nr:MAG: hypothetical protein EOP87_00025 [Verrucomicrobiaceae bacterium]